MPPENQPVVVRTSASANNYWSRPREAMTASGHECLPVENQPVPLLPSNAGTPYGRQRPPFSPMPPPTPPSPRPVLAPIPVNVSREVERAVLCRDLSNADDVERDRARLQRKVRRLESQVKSLLQINSMLTSEMAREYRTRCE